MKVAFAGPSICDVALDLGAIAIRPPAAQGDLLRAVFEGANVIGLIDGAFEATAAVWHKEILYAIGSGVVVLGGASMGALRAAECAAFGMIPVGVIAARYLSGEYNDDALVAITHGPAELGSPPLTEALVDCEATIQAMSAAGALGPDEAAAAMSAARRLFYKDRDVAAVARAAKLDAEAFEAAYRRCRISRKSEDAAAVISCMKSLPDRRTVPRHDWLLSEPPRWLECLATARGPSPGADGSQSSPRRARDGFSA